MLDLVFCYSNNLFVNGGFLKKNQIKINEYFIQIVYFDEKNLIMTEDTNLCKNKKKDFIKYSSF